MTNFIALYRGESVAAARLIAVTSEPQIVERFLQQLAGTTDSEEPNAATGYEPLRVVQGDEEYS